MPSKYSPTEKLIVSNYAPLETIPPLSETFFNIIDKKRDVPDGEVRWTTRYMDRLFWKWRKSIFLEELIKREIYSFSFINNL